MVPVVVVGDAHDTVVVMGPVVLVGGVEDPFMPFLVPVPVVEVQQFLQCVDPVVLQVPVELLQGLMHPGAQEGLYGLVRGVVSLVVMQVVGEPAVLELGEFGVGVVGHVYGWEMYRGYNNGWLLSLLS